jgi:hypothetical protein
MVDLDNGAWRSTAEQLASETDPKKLHELVSQLCNQLESEPNPVTLINAD